MSAIRFIFRKLSQALSSKKIFLTKSLTFRKKPQALPANFDYMRFATLGLCYEEIVNNKVKGSVAELGVYKGDFAWRLNFLFADRSLYLFDTFSGFDTKDMKQEVTGGFQQANQDFSDTSIDIVLSKMANPKNCILKKGYFPDTTIGIDDTFCFVSIDADLHNPILAGLNYFYPRLEKGGYLFIHDFNNDMYKGAKEAVLRFCTDQNIGYVPIPDSGGTVIITK